MTRFLVAALSLVALTACIDGRTDQTACAQYANTMFSLGCDDGAADEISDYCSAEPGDELTDAESSESVSFWDCLSRRATCDVEARFEGNQACAVAADLETQEDIFFDDRINDEGQRDPPQP
jgi:hypothetical protein